MGKKRYCPYCGHEIEQGWQVCPYCGHSLSGTTQVVSKNSIYYGIALALGVLFVVLAVYMGYQSVVVVTNVSPFVHAMGPPNSPSSEANYTNSLLDLFQDSAISGMVVGIIGISLLAVAVVKREHIILSAAFNAVSIGLFILAQTALTMVTIFGLSIITYHGNNNAKQYASVIVNASTNFQYANLVYAIVGAFLLFFTLFIYLKQNESKKQK